MIKDYKKEVTTKRKTWRQWYSAIIVNIICFCHGCTLGWLSPTLPLLSGPDSPFEAPLTPSDINLIGSMMPLAGTIFTFIFGWIADKYGRRRGLILSAIPYLICWVIKVVSYNSTSLIIARFFSGIGASGMLVITPMYCVEIASQTLKGALGSLMVLSMNFGILMMYISGMYLSYGSFLWLVVPQPIIFMVLMCFLPDSPPYLIKKDKIQEAEKALAWLNSVPIDSDVVKSDITIINNEIMLVKSTGSESIWTIFKSSPATLKAFIVIILLFMVQAFMGMFPIVSYTEDIFKQAGTEISPSTCSVVFGCAMIIGSISASMLIEKLGRKILLIGSCTAVSMSLLVMGIYFYVQDGGMDMEGFRIIPVIALPVTVCSFNVGAGPIPYILTSELITPKIRGLVTGMILTFTWFLYFLITFGYGPGVLLIGMSGVFTFFGLCSLGGLFLVIFFLPETKGNSLEQSLSFYNKTLQLSNVAP